MPFREDLERKIEKKRREIMDLEVKIRTASIYVQGLEDALKLLGDEIEPPLALPSVDTLRSGSKTDRAREILRIAGKALHVSHILEALGETNDPESRASLVGSLGAYVRDRKIFTRPGPNTFGLIEFDNAHPPSSLIQAPGGNPITVSSPQDSTDDLRKRLYASLMGGRQTHLADAVENSQVTELASEVVFTTSKMYQMFLKDPALENAVMQVVGRPIRVTIKVGDVGSIAAIADPRPPKGFGLDPKV